MRNITFDEMKAINDSIIQSIIMNDVVSSYTKIRGLLENTLYVLLKKRGNNINAEIKFKKLLEIALNEEDLIELSNELGELYGKLSNVIHLNNNIKENIDNTIEACNKIFNELLIKIFNEDQIQLGNQEYTFRKWSNIPESIEIQTFENLITSSKRIIIPKFQRHFVWNDNMILNFLDSENFISNIYLSKGITNSKDYYVIDGQQRIRTTILFYSWIEINGWLTEGYFELSNKVSYDFIREIYKWPEEIYQLFTNKYTKVQALTILDKIINRRYLINWIDWDNQIKAFNSLNYSHVPLTNSELIISWMLGTSEIDNQTKIISNISNTALEMTYGINYKKILKKSLHLNFYKLINWTSIMQVIQYKYSMKYDILNPNVPKANNFIKRVERFKILSSYLFQNGLWNKIHSFVVNNDAYSLKEKRDVVEHFIYKSKILNKIKLMDDNRFLNSLILINTVLNNNLFYSHFTSKENNDISLDWIVKITAFIHILYDIDDSGNIIPSKYFKENSEPLFNFIFNFLIGFDTNSLMIRGELDMGFMMTKEQSDKLLNDFANRDKLIYSTILIIINKLPNSLDFTKLINDLSDNFKELILSENKSQLTRSIYDRDISDLKKFNNQTLENLIRIFSEDSFQRITLNYNSKINSFSTITIKISETLNLVIFILLDLNHHLSDKLLFISGKYMKDDLNNDILNEIIKEDLNPNNYIGKLHLIDILKNNGIDNFVIEIAKKTKLVLMNDIDNL